MGARSLERSATVAAWIVEHICCAPNVEPLVMLQGLVAASTPEFDYSWAKERKPLRACRRSLLQSVRAYHLSSRIHGNTQNAMKKANYYARRLLKVWSTWLDIITMRRSKSTGIGRHTVVDHVANWRVSRTSLCEASHAAWCDES